MQGERDADEAARLLFARPATFMLSVVGLDQLPPGDVPEIAFAGRSNVGKSSLINAIVGQEGLARTSNTPGRTQQLNFFDLGGRLRLVDLPGYGYAEAPKDLVRSWQKLIFAYLRGRANLRRALILIDSRHGLKRTDVEAMGMLATAAVPFQVILTKADLVRATALADLIDELRQQLRRTPAAIPEPLVTSARAREGVEALRAELAALAEGRELRRTDPGGSP
ncbi:MAG: ribosome biogenesis GTP-binding protein YihA/YsxC [Geminicoccaceae bacterium]